MTHQYESTTVALYPAIDRKRAFELYRERQALPNWKRLSDCAIAIPLLVLCAPIILAAIAIIKLTSSGPGIYSQTRLGFNRRPFTLYKIRTMTHNCEANTGACWATAKDTRVTAVGRFLRKTHIDELPQLWNVLRGEMTLVGPRPERPEIIARIEPLIPGYGLRLNVYPGVTGLAQVQLPPDTSVESVRRKLVYDMYYASTFNFWLDFRLILVTAVKVFGLVALTRILLRIPGPDQIEPRWTVSAPATSELAFAVELPNESLPRDFSRV